MAKLQHDELYIIMIININWLLIPLNINLNIMIINFFFIPLTSMLRTNYVLQYYNFWCLLLFYCLSPDKVPLRLQTLIDD